MSPVVAKVILVVVAVVMALAVGYFALNVITATTRFERLELSGAYMQDPRTIVFLVRNPGVEVSRVRVLLLQGKPAAEASGEVLLRPGDQVTCEVRLVESPPSGIVVELGVITSTGKTFTTMLQADQGTGVSGELEVESFACFR
ncbi:MAG: hypothetical protein NYU90_04955 [Aigarchaeota archaeon]|nr:hypothetical protein [Candidatus Calditenuis fumarioli]